jgi:predicted membrane protein
VFEESDLPRANAIALTISTGAMVVGPLLGGVLRAAGGSTPPLWIVLGISCVGMGIAWIVSAPYRSVGDPTAEGLSTFGDSLDIMVREKTIYCLTLTLCLLWLGIGGTSSLEVPFVTRVLHGGPTAYAFLGSFTAAAMAAASVAFERLGRSVPPTAGLVVGEGGMGSAGCCSPWCTRCCERTRPPVWLPWGIRSSTSVFYPGFRSPCLNTKSVG